MFGHSYFLFQNLKRKGIKVEQHLKHLIENIQKKPLDFFYHNQ